MLAIAEGGEAERVLVSEVHELWRKRGSASCPTIVGFCVPFPLSYVDERGNNALPPTFDAQFFGVPGLLAQTSYSLSVLVTRPRLTAWKKQQRYVSFKLVYRIVMCSVLIRF